jgi:two-component system alkaline phosphatase synthesis response regulator PhoP
MILIADDEKDALNILQKKLKSNNYEVNAATTGKEAFDLAKSEKPDLMLLDIMLSDMDAYTLISSFKEDKTLKDVPIILITGKELVSNAIEQRASELGVCGYLMKPLSFEDMLAKIKEIIGQAIFYN